MKIPRHLNAVLDWAAANARVILVVLPVVVAAIAVVWLPALAAFVVGIGAGGLLVHLGMSRKVSRLRAEADDLLRENGALRHEKTVIANGTASPEASVLTQKLPSIPQTDEL